MKGSALLFSFKAVTERTPLRAGVNAEAVPAIKLRARATNFMVSTRSEIILACVGFVVLLPWRLPL